EGGRGLLLVDHFATSWGTNQHSLGKTVWFRLTPGHQHGGTNGPVPEASPPSPAALTALTHSDLPLADLATIGPLSARLLARRCGATGAVGGVTRLDQADGHGRQPIAEYGQPVLERSGLVRVSLPVSWPWRGDLLLTPAEAPNPYATPLAELVAERLGLALENERLRRTDLRRQAWLTFLAEVSELLAQSLDIELTLALIPRRVVPRLGGWCAVYRFDEWGQPTFGAAAHVDETALPDLLNELRSASTNDVLRDAVRLSSQVHLPAPLD